MKERCGMMVCRRFIIAAGLVFGLSAFAGPVDKVWLCGTTDRDPVSYAVGEDMVLTLTPSNVVGEVPPGEYFLDWKRTDDFGGCESGRVAFTGAPFVYHAKLDKPGFFRLQAFVVDKTGKHYLRKFTGDASTPEGQKAMNAFERSRKDIFFDGGAGADVDKLLPREEPKDFDAFWLRQFARLDRIPVRADMREVDAKVSHARIYAVSVDCAGLRPATGYLTVPKGVDLGKKYPCRLHTYGYSGKSCVHETQRTATDGEIVFSINGHGLKLVEFGATDADTKALRWEVGSNGYDYAFDPKQNADAETAYFNGMVLRVKRALQFLKTLEGWNGKDLNVTGASQGGLQTVWAAACGEGVTQASPCVTWCCDIANNTARIERKISSDGWYIASTPALEYYDPVFFAKRIPSTCHVDITRAGLGDYVCPPMGLARLWNAIPSNATIKWVQGSQHGYAPPGGRHAFRKK